MKSWKSLVHETREHSKVSQKVNEIIQQKAYLHSKAKEHNLAKKKKKLSKRFH